MFRFRCMRSLQKFVAVYCAVYKYFYLERHPNSRVSFKLNRVVTLSEWQLI